MALALGMNGCRRVEMKVLGFVASRTLRGSLVVSYTQTRRPPSVMSETQCR